MPRRSDRGKMSHLTQPSITEYFSVRKSRKRKVENPKEEENLSTSSIVQKKARSTSSNSSRLLISVLEKQTRSKVLTTLVSRKENSNPNTKNVSVFSDSSKTDSLGTNSLDSSELLPSKEESSKGEELVNGNDCVSREKNDESSTKELTSAESASKVNSKKVEIVRQAKKIRTKVSTKLLTAEVPVDKIPQSEAPISTASVTRVNPEKVEIVSSLKQKIQTEISNKLLTDEVSAVKQSPTVKPKNKGSIEMKNVEDNQLANAKEPQLECEETKKIAAIDRSRSQKPFLPLPSDYKFLLEVFTCIDRVAMMLYKRGETITFTKLQPALQNMSTCEVTLDHLAQIKTIYPEAYNYQEKNMRVIATGSNETRCEMVIKPNFESQEGTKGPHIESSGTDVLLRRRKKFYHVLLERVKDEHEKFLIKMCKSKTPIPKEKLKCWHSKFEFEKCGKIELADLPVSQKIKLTSPKEVLEKMKECFKGKTNSKNPTKVLETVPNHVKTKEDECYHRLPSIAKTIRYIFSNEGKSVMTFNQVVQKLQHSYKVKLSSAEVEKHVELLCQLVPEWISLFNLGKIDRLKIQNEVPFKKVTKILEAKNFKNSSDHSETVPHPVEKNRNEEAEYHHRLPSIAKTVCYIFSSEGKNVMTFNQVVQKLQHSYKEKLSLAEVEKHVKLLCQSVPEWISSFNLGKTDRLKIQNKVPFEKVTKILEAKNRFIIDT